MKTTIYHNNPIINKPSEKFQLKNNLLTKSYFKQIKTYNLKNKWSKSLINKYRKMNRINYYILINNKNNKSNQQTIKRFKTLTKNHNNNDILILLSKTLNSLLYFKEEMGIY